MLAFPEEGVDCCRELPVALVHGLGESQGDVAPLRGYGHSLRHLQQPGDVEEDRSLAMSRRQIGEFETRQRSLKQ